MNIIEKLGITPGPWIQGNYLTLLSENRGIDMNVFSAAPEMLEALIDDVFKNWDAVPFPALVMEKKIRIIEKATGKTWADIKEVINE